MTNPATFLQHRLILQLFMTTLLQTSINIQQNNNTQLTIRKETILTQKMKLTIRHRTDFDSNCIDKKL